MAYIKLKKCIIPNETVDVYKKLFKKGITPEQFYFIIKIMDMECQTSWIQHKKYHNLAIAFDALNGDDDKAIYNFKPHQLDMTPQTTINKEQEREEAKLALLEKYAKEEKDKKIQKMLADLKVQQEQELFIKAQQLVEKENN